MLNDEFIINIRKLLNLGEYEAKAYSILLTSGPLTAIEICKKGEIPQPKIYETLRNLQTKTLIETLNIKPQIWRVSDPINNLKSIIKEKIKELKDIEKFFKLYFNKNKNLTDNFGLWTGYGRENFLKKAAEIINRAENYGYATTKSFSRLELLDSSVLSAIKRGVKIKLLGLCKPSGLSLARAKWYQNNGIEIRYVSKEDQPVFGIIDDKETCFRVDNFSDSSWIWTNNSSIISVMKNQFNILWDQAKKI